MAEEKTETRRKYIPAFTLDDLIALHSAAKTLKNYLPKPTPKELTTAIRRASYVIRRGRL